MSFQKPQAAAKLVDAKQGVFLSLPCSVSCHTLLSASNA